MMSASACYPGEWQAGIAEHVQATQVEEKAECHFPIDMECQRPPTTFKSAKRWSAKSRVFEQASVPASLAPVQTPLDFARGASSLIVPYKTNRIGKLLVVLSFI